MLRAQAFPADARPSLLHVLFLQRPDDGTELLLQVESAGRAGEAEVRLIKSIVSKSRSREIAEVCRASQPVLSSGVSELGYQGM